MKRSIWKYPLSDFAPNNNGDIEVPMPRGAEILTVQAQGNIPCVWARVDPTETNIVKRIFTICETGADAPFTDYVGTVLLFNGARVLHIFVVQNGTRQVPR